METTSDARTALKQRMTAMGIEGFSSMGQFTPEEQMGHLDEIARMRAAREKNASDGKVAETKGLETANGPPQSGGLS